jgi:hypothetical protein
MPRNKATKPKDWEADVLAAIEGRTIADAARLLGIPRQTLQSRLETINRTKKISVSAAGAVRPPQPLKAAHKTFASPSKSRTFILTSAQDSTPLYEEGFRNLEAYAGRLGAEIKVGGFTYQKGLFEDHSAAAGVFDSRLAPYLSPTIEELCEGLVWYGAANILPTAADPLSGWDTQTRGAWAIFPHAKVALKSIPVQRGAPPKQIMTSGVVTKPNYVQRNAGQKAEFHHTPAATIVEVSHTGTFFVRQLVMASDGSFQDLCEEVKDGKVIPGRPIEGLNPGDVHLEYIDQSSARLVWGLGGASGCMLDVLKPRHQFIHDSFDFASRSPHTRNDPHERAKRLAEGLDSVENMFRDTARFLRDISRPWCRTVHVMSNHNHQVERWLKDYSAASDAANAKIWHRLNYEWHAAIEREDASFSAVEFGLKNAGIDLSETTFLRYGDSFQICQGPNPVECGAHGDIGPKGQRGSAASLSKVIGRMNVGHYHGAVIQEGLFAAGTNSIIPMEYASNGPNVWQRSQIVTYANGKRTIVTLSGDEWRAP